jgi:hypothetical protein
VTDYSRQVSGIGEYGPANDNGAPASAAKAGKKAAPEAEPDPKTTTKAKAAGSK